MLADNHSNGPIGTLTVLHRRAEWLETVIDFVFAQLPHWRDDPARPAATAETKLTEQLCRFLESATRHAGLDEISFAVEPHDPKAPSRRIDLAFFPRDCVINVGGRHHTLYDLLIPIECKRLPTPIRRGKHPRERREYLHVQKKSTGGVQRFKAGHHGAGFDHGVMIGYVQKGSILTWRSTIDRWLAVLIRARIPGWASNERLSAVSHDSAERVGRSRSRHLRAGSTPITLHHLWVEM